MAVTAEDWGWWRTVTGNIERGFELLAADAPGSGPALEDRERIRGRLLALEAAIDEAPKSLRWRLRARVGDRVRWYEEPEEEEHG